VDAAARFSALVAPSEDWVPLDEAWALIGAHAHPHVGPEEVLERLDRLAERCTGPTLDHLVRLLFEDEGFVGNTADYYDADNSYAPPVLERRLGIPISLSVLAIEVGRRVGVPLAGVSMPGHFLLRDRVDPEVFIDPFARGRMLDRAGCDRTFRQIHGPDAVLDGHELQPVDNRRILARMLANLRGIYVQADDTSALAWVLQLLVAIPGVPRGERKALAAALAASGRFGDAATQLELLAAEEDGPQAEDHRGAAVRLRARLN
jgi:regulator of sirC expression with transglutaminase-like and TPR domain